MTTEHVCDLLSLTYMAFTLSAPGRFASDRLRANRITRFTLRQAQGERRQVYPIASGALRDRPAQSDR
jgi:hypothetical protein